jgi:hypothetical protein
MTRQSDNNSGALEQARMVESIKMDGVRLEAAFLTFSDHPGTRNLGPETAQFWKDNWDPFHILHSPDF